MDILTLAMAKAYCDSKGGYEYGYSITFDGNPNGKVVIPLNEALKFVKVSNKVLTKKELIGATFVDPEKDEYIISEQNIIDNSAVGVSTTFYGILHPRISDTTPYVVSCKACSFAFGGGTVVVPEDGTYFFCGSFGGNTMFVSELSNEAIVPIDQKYLPGVCLPVVELETVIEHDAVLSESDSAKLLEVFEIGTPVVIVFTMGDYRNTAVFTRFTSPDNAVKAFSTALFSGQVRLLSQESGEFTVFVQ